MAKYLLSRGADPNLANSEGETPLSLAVYQGELELVQLLFKSGAKLKSKTQPPRNLLGAAAISPYGAKVVPVLKLLIQKGCNPRELQDGYNLFHQVCLSCKLPLDSKLVNQVSSHEQ